MKHQYIYRGRRNLLREDSQFYRTDVAYPPNYNTIMPLSPFTAENIGSCSFLSLITLSHYLIETFVTRLFFFGFPTVIYFALYHTISPSTCLILLTMQYLKTFLSLSSIEIVNGASDLSYRAKVS